MDTRRRGYDNSSVMVDRAKLINFLNEYFNDDEIVMLCAVEFPPVFNDFGGGQRKSQKVLDLVTYCDRYGEGEKLLTVLQRERPKLYSSYFGERTAMAVPSQPPVPISRQPRQVFISHAHQEAALAQRLRADLEARGWKVWIAPDSIQPGEQWVEAVNRGLEESGVFLLLLSPAAVVSNWVKRETNVAIELEHDGKMLFYPLEVQPCDLPPLWRSYQRTPFGGRYEAALEKLLARLDGRAAPSPAASLLPPEPKPITQTQTSDFSKKSDVSSSPKPVRLTNSEIKTEIRIHPITGKEMVRIPAGEFLYGENKETQYLDEYWIDKTPVTNAEYGRFVAATSYEPPQHWNGNTPPNELADHPVVYVSWHDAQAYAEWAGCELPTEEQWEKAARGTDGRTYPWGNDWHDGYCNISESGIRGTSNVGRFSPQGDSPTGCADMSGNVWEWTSGQAVRGGAWDSAQRYSSLSSRFKNIGRAYKYQGTGFRVVTPNLSGP